MLVWTALSGPHPAQTHEFAETACVHDGESSGANRSWPLISYAGASSNDAMVELYSCIVAEFVLSLCRVQRYLFPAFSFDSCCLGAASAAYLDQSALRYGLSLRYPGHQNSRHVAICDVPAVANFATLTADLSTAVQVGLVVCLPEPNRTKFVHSTCPVRALSCMRMCC